MNKTITLLLTVILYQLSIAQVVHKDFGSGLIIALDENYQLDVNDDGTADLVVNSVVGELGFEPISGQGCVNVKDLWSTNAFGALSLNTFEEGELINWASSIFTWSEVDPSAAYSISGGFDNLWSADEDKYVGFMILNGGKAACGWIKVRISASEQNLVIKELAYQDDYFYSSESGIYAGTLSSLGDLVDVQNFSNKNVEINIHPNPASSSTQISYTLSDAQEVKLEVIDLLGRTVFSDQLLGRMDTGIIDLDLNKFTPGNYFLKLSTPEGYQVKQLQIR